MCISFGNPSDPCCDDAPAVPSLGFIQRYVYPEPIADDIGLSDAQWSTGITGNVAPKMNRTCLYHHFTTPNKKTTSVYNILQPLRFSIECPANDGGQWDHWTDLTVGGTHPNYKSGQLTFDGFSSVGLREKLLPRDWHARFENNLLRITNFPRPYDCLRDFDIIDSGGGESYIERALQAIAPGVPPWQLEGSSDSYPVTSQAFAFRHVVNGVPGPVKIIADLEHADAAFCRVTPADTYQVDVWYRIGVTALDNFGAAPGKGCVYWPLRRLSNGSRQGSGYFVTLYNVNFSPFFNHETQTYSVTAAGHTGWTLRDGSNGPHALIAQPGWNAGGSGSGAGVQTTDPTSFWARIFLDFSREIVSAVLVPGDAMIAKYPAIARAFLYRPMDNPGLYRKSTQSSDYGGVTHAGSGRFYQDGTTVFELVPWTTEGGDGSTSYAFQPAVGRADGGSSAPSYREVPRRLIFTRIAR